MEKVLSFTAAEDYIHRVVKDDLDQGQSYVIIGGEGRGHREILDCLDKDVAGKGFRVFRANSFSPNEILKYQPFNEILNQIHNQFRNRDLNEIINDLHLFLTDNNDGKTLFFIDNLEFSSEGTQDLFVFVSRLTQKLNFKIIGTYTTREDHISRESHNFLDLIGYEDHMRILILQKPTIEDVKFVLHQEGYKLPEGFIIEMFRLINGNMSTLKYVLRYYEDIGIINKDKEVDEVVYRFIPIPPTVEIYYEKILSEFTNQELEVVQLMVILQEEMTPEFISELTGLNKEKVLRALEKLENHKIIVENNFRYSIINDKFGDFLNNRISRSRKMLISGSVFNSEAFNELPLRAKLNIMEKNGNYKEIEEIISEQWRELAREFTSTQETLSFVNIISGHIKDPTTKLKADLLLCDSLYLRGNYDEARVCYESKDFSELDKFGPKINLSNILSATGRHKEALKITQNILSQPDLSDNDRLMVLLSQAEDYFRLKEYDESLRLSNEAYEISIKTDNPEVVSRSLHNIGNVKAEKFEFDSALKMYYDSLEISRKLELWDQISRSMNNIAIIKSFMGSFEESIQILREIIDNSYITGNLTSRAYAMYNIIEIYHIVGRNEESFSYMATASKLIRLVGDQNLIYQYNRFLSIYFFENLKFDQAISSINEAISAANQVQNTQWIQMAEGLKQMFFSLFKGSESPEVLDSLLRDYKVNDEFVPLFYSLATYFFLIRRDFESADKALGKAMNSAEEIGDYHAIAQAKLAKSILLLTEGKMDELRLYLYRVETKESQVFLYDVVMKSLNAVVNSASQNSKSYLEEINRINSSLNGSTTEVIKLLPLAIRAVAEYYMLEKKDALQELFERVAGHGVTITLGKK